MDGDSPAISSAVGVAVLLDQHWDALDHDFRHHYHLDLEDACWGPRAIGVRRLKAYIAQLPPTSAIAREMGWSWDEMREMTATLIEVTVNSRRTKKSDPVFKWPRPSMDTYASKAPEKPPLTLDGFDAFLSSIAPSSAPVEEGVA